MGFLVEYPNQAIAGIYGVAKRFLGGIAGHALQTQAPKE
jgi:hypothetical protein